MVYVEPGDGWAARQMLQTALERLGYQVWQVGAGEVWRLLLEPPETQKSGRAPLRGARP